MDWSSVAPPGSRPRYIGLPQAHTDEGGTAAAENALVTVRGGSAAAENGVAAVEEGSAGAKNGLAAVRKGFAAAEIGSSRMQGGHCRGGGAHLAHAEWGFRRGKAYLARARWALPRQQEGSCARRKHFSAASEPSLHVQKPLGRCGGAFPDGSAPDFRDRGAYPRIRVAWLQYRWRRQVPSGPTPDTRKTWELPSSRRGLSIAGSSRDWIRVRRRSAIRAAGTWHAGCCGPKP